MITMEPRVIGDYIMGPPIGSGSFAVVWRSRHRVSGLEVAIKEIDQRQLSPKVQEHLFKEISILSTIKHPNIVRLFETIQTNDRIYLVLEYCAGGDLAVYIQRHGKVSETVARHFMRQLAAGLQVLQEKNLIHRDLKPQNLLLATTAATPIMKIGDFGFARSLTPQSLADTLCGSPYYMAPEIIENQKYDAKADLWSVGAILYQLVIGRLPFDGNTQYQLFQNILASTELYFPPEALEELHSDCLDLCRNLLRQNPDERLTFKAFFNHNFLQNSRSTVGKLTVHQSGGSLSEMSPTIASDSRLMQSVEKDYVLVHSHFASLEAFSDYFDASVQDGSLYSISQTHSKIANPDIGVPKQTTDLTSSSSRGLENLESNKLEACVASCEFTALREEHEISSLQPSNRLKLLHEYGKILKELSQQQYDKGLYLESLAVELVILAIWKKALEICNSWMASLTTSGLPESSSTNESISSSNVELPQTSELKINFSDPPSVSMWAKHEFVLAVDRAEKLSCRVQNMDGAAEMPDAMEIIFQTALSIGTSGAVDEYMENRDRASASYSRAMLLLSFLVREAENLPLNPPFSLIATNKERILQYIYTLQSRKKSSSESSSNKLLSLTSK
ncbi:serine/threonine-protein kinase ATG1a isoform X2 [Vigna radiata var. radiata]|uniref:Serine/threonine-protein kinase ATG1a isoform X2 n=1 Tax=Vigna radiata var. radiata TaxID=3916 RepID=A0A1S3VTU1_VIGRR|nr:serine/threonine-protein kinase ATG1a isoform X2 [Vigna radiata var. radiata]